LSNVAATLGDEATGLEEPLTVEIERIVDRGGELENMEEELGGKAVEHDGEVWRGITWRRRVKAVKSFCARGPSGSEEEGRSKLTVKLAGGSRESQQDVRGCSRANNAPCPALRRLVNARWLETDEDRSEERGEGVKGWELLWLLVDDRRLSIDWLTLSLSTRAS
jgi:hypothetical protein